MKDKNIEPAEDRSVAKKARQTRSGKGMAAPDKMMLLVV